VNFVTWKINIGTRDCNCSPPGKGMVSLRHLFDWMVIGQIMPVNPADFVGFGPRHRAVSQPEVRLDAADRARAVLTLLRDRESGGPNPAMRLEPREEVRADSASAPDRGGGDN